MRPGFLQSIHDQLDKSRSVLIYGERGTGKSWVLGSIAQSRPNALYLPNLSSKKTALLAILQRLFKDKKLTDYAYFTDWRNVEPRLSRLTVESLVELARPCMADYILVIDNLDLCTERAIKDVVVPLAQNRLLAAATTGTVTKDKRLSLVRDRFIQLELPPMTDDELRAMLWTLTDREDYDDRRARILETKILNLAQGRPAVVADLIEQLRTHSDSTDPAVASASLDEIRDLDHTLTDDVRINLIFPLFIGLVAVIAGARFFARGIDDLSLYVIAGMLTAASMAIRPIMWRMLPRRKP
jgi:hypothetical protein